MSNVESVTEAEEKAAAGSSGVAAEKPRSLTADAWDDLRRNWIFWMAAVLVVLVVTMAIFPGLFTSADPKACALSRQHAGPSGAAIFGYNFQGCDVYARTIYGARNSVLIALLATIMAGVIGLVVGMAAGYFGGWVDALLARGIDIVLGIPTLLAAIVLARRLASDPEDSGFWAVVVTLGVLTWTTGARIMRSSVIAAKSQDYVAAARMLGAGPGRLMFRHILPNAMAPIIVLATAGVGGAIIAETSLSFLGLGAPITTPSWGEMLSNQARRFMTVAPWLGIFPGLAITLVVLAFNLFGDALRDVLDPRLRS